MRSVIKQPNAVGIKDIVNQQFETARPIIAADLAPIIEPEVDIHCPEKAEAEETLKVAILKGLDALPAGQLVMLRLTLPERDDLCRVRQASQDREGGCPVGWVYSGRMQPTTPQESRRGGELFTGAGRGALGPAIRCGVQRNT